MILAEKLFQKLNNLRSKGELKDFFMIFDDHKELVIKLENGSVSNERFPTSYDEKSEGQFLIIWDEEYISHGDLNCASLGDFDEFFELAKKIKIKYSDEVFIPEKGIFPMAITYSKALADMVDIPEYLLKIADVADELNKMVKLTDSTTEIKAFDGVKHVYSSRQLDENFPYTLFTVHNKLDNIFNWSVRLSEAFPIIKLQEVFSFFGNMCNILKEKDEVKLESKKKYNVILGPDLFKEIFTYQVLDQISGRSLLNGTSIFNRENFINKDKFFGTLSLSYDPLLKQKSGTYKFTDFGLKAEKQYFIKYGKLDTPVLDMLNYSKLNFPSPTMQITDYSNLKFEGIKKHKFEEIIASCSNAIFAITPIKLKKVNNKFSEMEFDQSIFIDQEKLRKSSSFGIKVSILNLIQNNQLELVEFVDGQYGCKILNIDID